MEWQVGSTSSCVTSGRIHSENWTSQRRAEGKPRQLLAKGPNRAWRSVVPKARTVRTAVYGTVCTVVWEGGAVRSLPIPIKLSYRDVCDLMAERGVSVVHTTVLRWVL